jgi:hypothetical protein
MPSEFFGSVITFDGVTAVSWKERRSEAASTLALSAIPLQRMGQHALVTKRPFEDPIKD